MVAQTPATGTLIILGVSASDLFAKCSTRLVEGGMRVVLVDPEPHISLQQKLCAEHVEAAAYSGDGNAEMTFYSIEGLRSFSPPTHALKDVFPGLKERGRESVPTITVTSLLERLQPLNDPIRVWVDMPGQEAHLLDALKRTGLLERAEEVVVRCGVESFFEASEDCAAIKNRLMQETFELIEADESDPDWPVLWFRDSPTLRRLAQLETELEQTRAQNVAMRDELTEKTKVQAESEAALVKAERELAAALKSHQERLESLNARLLAQLKAEQETSEKMQRTEVSYRIARRDLTLALEQQNRLQVDYESLQKQYALLCDEKTELEMLLQQLTPRLREASQYLRDMRAKTADQEEEDDLQDPKVETATPLQGADKEIGKKTRT
ncbi:hypothetical protein [Phaeobacter gallaeciensis]|uniref:hypothetical protein n=1 Tax=Phaeobacter gallaeciensis TaxID=60890 RepID=UPI00237F7AAC|nr:hypothetical protein [Phaeobacter gallaeciensis]MDE4142361.1 hypothetical protein [Phaeobacter gallaeciensis]MDE4150806.1 hypothetical protein [Phaeobacter gallaeciensis]MDE4155035.1 hypothetical protein [Phaeobacter gallaeciensis]MDE4230425.1 hypothetical protein [Phaeobacter gallaeciensis]MDE4259502.1 hypothetical protein [Phaeobacter gallaeciensis]